MNRLRWSAVVLGIVCGFLSTHTFLAGTWINLPLWAFAGCALGWFVQTKREVMWCGALYGFFLSVTFLYSGFAGTPDKLPIFTLIVFGLSAIGIMCGVGTAALGNSIRKRFGL